MNKLSQPSTWRGIAWILGSIAMTYDPAWALIILKGVMIVSGVLGLTDDRKLVNAQFETINKDHLYDIINAIKDGFTQAVNTPAVAEKGAVPAAENQQPNKSL